MGKKIRITEEQFKSYCRAIRNTNRKIYITEEQFKEIGKLLMSENMDETNAIRPWADDDYKKVNPTQAKDVDFGQLEDIGKELGIKGNVGGDLYGKPNIFQQHKINAVQDDLSQKVSDRYKEKTGSNIIPREELGNVTNKKLEGLLCANGMKMEIAGKTFSYGNSKLPENTIIINLTSAGNCPSIEAGDCPFGKICYAKRTEKRYDATEARNLRNQMALKLLSPKEILRLIEVYIEQAPVRIQYIRISEDGDFPDQSTVNFCDAVAGHLKKKYGIQTTAYTHRQLDYSGVKNMQINVSDYRIQSGDRYFIIVDPKIWAQLPDDGKVHLSSEGLQLPGLNLENGFWKCQCDCRKCHFCYQTKEQNGEPADRMITVVEEIRK